MTRTRIRHGLSILWLLNFLMVVLIIFTPLLVKPFGIFYVQVSLALIGLPLINWFDKRSIRTRRIAVGTFVIFGGATLCFYLFLDWRGDWKTQTVRFQNLHFSNRTIEFQLQDKGAFGYNRRLVERWKLLPFLEWTKEIEDGQIDTVVWKKVDLDINEMGLKGG